MYTYRENEKGEGKRERGSRPWKQRGGAKKFFTLFFRLVLKRLRGGRTLTKEEETHDAQHEEHGEADKTGNY